MWLTRCSVCSHQTELWLWGGKKLTGYRGNEIILNIFLHRGIVTLLSSPTPVWILIGDDRDPELQKKCKGLKSKKHKRAHQFCIWNYSSLLTYTQGILRSSVLVLHLFTSFFPCCVLIPWWEGDGSCAHGWCAWEQHLPLHWHCCSGFQTGLHQYKVVKVMPNMVSARAEA